MTRRFSGPIKNEPVRVPPHELEQMLLHELRLPDTEGNQEEEHSLDSDKTTCVPISRIPCRRRKDSRPNAQQKEDRAALILECFAAAFLFCVVVFFYYSLLLVLEQALPLRIFP